jgi:NAD-dependent dihydropyrimidine dehydrogenase PreA subunit
MINIQNKSKCCGCSACVQRCPKQCISLKEDNEGFLYPEVYKETCIDCGLCEKVCPVIHQDEPRKPLKVYAAKNLDEEIRKQSSSGGVFTLLAEQIIHEGGVVFGARFDGNWEVKHDFTETIEGLAPFRGSKYIQSRIEDNYIKAEEFLKQGRKVLFSGTPCQVSGLRRYLQKNYDNLLTVDIICHGVPSNKVWQKYLKEILFKIEILWDLSIDRYNYKKQIKNISFRDKRNGWKNYGFKLNIENIEFYENHRNNIYMKAYLSNVSLRPSCYNCPCKEQKSHSDITLSDLWLCKDNIHLDNFNKDKGLSCIFVNSNNLESYLKKADLIEISIDEGVQANPCFYNSVKCPDNRKKFWTSLAQSNDFIMSTNKFGEFSVREKIKNFLVILLVKIKLLRYFKLLFNK